MKLGLNEGAEQGSAGMIVTQEALERGGFISLGVVMLTWSR